MKKILKLSIVLLGALFVLLGCRSESKASFVFQTANAEVTFTYVYDKGNDTVLSLTTKSVLKLANIPEYDAITRKKSRWNREWNERYRRHKSYYIRQWKRIKISRLKWTWKNSNWIIQKVVQKHQSYIEQWMWRL